MLPLEAIRDCLDGAIPSAVATCAPDGNPNVTFVSQVHYVDPGHVALSFQFFNKTHENVRANRHATALVNHPLTGARYRLELEYLRTETEGPLFESMKAKLAGIASHTGMTGIFRLRGSDVYRVESITACGGKSLPLVPPRTSLLSTLRTATGRLAASTGLEELLDEALLTIESLFGVRHAMLLMLDRAGKRLFTVASRGYSESGVGSEIAVGCGVIGVAAEHSTPIRISHMSAEYSYARAVRESAEREGLDGNLETAIPFPGLEHSRSQLAVPLMAGRRLLGVLYVESDEEMRFGYDDEDALVVLASHLGGEIQRLEESSESEEEAPSEAGGRGPAAGPAAVIRHYAADDSVFIDDDYLIKGVAGAILRKLVSDYLKSGRTDFTNRELRLDSSLGLPDVSDNLEARLVLLERRLVERRSPVRLEKTARGRFRLRIDRDLRLAEVP